MFLADVVRWHPSVANATFITDKDLAEINAIRNICQDANLFLCRFHVMKAFTEEINKLHLTNGETLLQVSFCNIRSVV